MPELPDIQVVSERISESFIGKQLTKIEFYRTKRVKPTEDAFVGSLTGKKVHSIARHGKALIIGFDGGDLVLIHLMLKGRVALDAEIRKSTVAILHFEHDAIQFYDPTSWTVIELVQDSDQLPPTPDALDRNAFTIGYWLDSLEKKSRKKIKTVLLDQDVVLGIGNAYADEIFAHAQIHPASKVANIPLEVKEKLFESIWTVLNASIDKLRAVDELDEVIDHRDFFSVHIKGREKSQDGFIIENVKVDGKSTYVHAGQIEY